MVKECLFRDAQSPRLLCYVLSSQRGWLSQRGMVRVHLCAKPCILRRHQTHVSCVMCHRGWPYVTCIETVATNNLVHGVDECWKMTSNCRDIFQSAGPATAFPPPMAIWLALGAGSLAACLIALLVRGDIFRLLARRSRTNLGQSVQFAPVAVTHVD